MYYYQHRRDDRPVIEAIQAHVNQNVAHGFRLTFKYLRQKGYLWNHKRIRRVYNLLGLNLHRKGKKRLPSRIQEPLLQPIEANYCWSMDFMSDSLVSGRRFRILNIIDDYNREVLAIEIGTSLPSKRVIRLLDQLIDFRGKPDSIRIDNGPEYTSADMAKWAESNQIRLRFIKPGKPTQNSYIERFNGTFRKEVLDIYAFSELYEVREISADWMDEYNEHRPHTSLGNMSPASFAKHRRALIENSKNQQEIITNRETLNLTLT
jgi:putative transposase